MRDCPSEPVDSPDADRRTVAMTNTYGTSSGNGVMSAEIDGLLDQPKTRLWDRIAHVFSQCEDSPRTASTGLAVLAYMSGSEQAEEER